MLILVKVYDSIVFLPTKSVQMSDMKLRNPISPPRKKQPTKLRKKMSEAHAPPQKPLYSDTLLKVA